MPKITLADYRPKMTAPIRIKKESDGSVIFSTQFCDMKISFHYPEENTRESVHQIATCLGYAGVFDGIE